MPGYVDHRLGERCPDCAGLADWIIGKGYFHKPTCPTQAGHEQAERREAIRRAERRRERKEWMQSPEAQRLRRLRSMGRVT